MCEFKILDKKNESQLAEEILVLSYSDDKTLQLRDILGISEEIDSALIYEVDTLDTKCKIIQHPIVKPFLEVLDKLNQDKATVQDIENLITQLEDLKTSL